MRYNIYVRELTGRITPLEVEFTDTIQHIKELLFQARGVTPEQQSLTFAGRRLQGNSLTLSHFNIQKESTIYLVVKVRGDAGDLGAYEAEVGPASAEFRTKAQFCESVVEASIIDFYKLGSDLHTYKRPCEPPCTISKLLKDGPTACMTKDEPPFLRWIHLPANNMSWVERLITRIYQETPPRAPQPSKKAGPSATVRREPTEEGISGADLLLSPNYWLKRQYVGRKSQGNTHGRFMRPCYSRVSTESESLGMQLISPYKDEKTNSFLFMPYIDWEETSMHEIRQKSLDQVMTARKPPGDPKWDALPLGAKLLIAYNWETSPIHDRRTLDQAFYYTLPAKDIRQRDKDQVLYRYTKGEEELKNDPRILMVDQLWIWILHRPTQGSNSENGVTTTVITSFPSRWSAPPTNQNYQPRGAEAQMHAAMEASNPYGRILAAFGEFSTGIVSANDLVCLIIDKCSGLFHPHPDEVDDNLDHLDVFASSIGKLASDQTALANDLWYHSAELKRQLERKEKLTSRSLRNFWSRDAATAEEPSHGPAVELAIEAEMNALEDITKETICLKEIKDILDELNSISFIFGQQITVVESMVEEASLLKQVQERTRRLTTASSVTPDLEDLEFKYQQVLKTLGKRNRDIENLKKNAHTVYKDLCDILDLKQKQASVTEALSTRQEAKETARQGQTILLFTVITIIFLPLSFIAAIYSMNAKEINNTDRPIRHIFGIMFPTTAAILIVSLLLAYNNFFTWLLAGIFAQTQQSISRLFMRILPPSTRILAPSRPLPPPGLPGEQADGEQVQFPAPVAPPAPPIPESQAGGVQEQYPAPVGPPAPPVPRSGPAVIPDPNTPRTSTDQIRRFQARIRGFGRRQDAGSGV